MDNIFQIGGQVFGDSFIGRKSFLKNFRKSFIESDMRTSKSIVGLTRTGKSSAIKNCFINIPKNIIYIYEDLNEWTNYNEIWQDICFEIKEYLDNNNISTIQINKYFEDLEQVDLPWIKISRTVKKIFEYLADNKIKTILVLDEFDNASTLFSERTKHFELFRTIFSDAKYNVSAITISRRNLYTIEGGTYQSSTFHGVLDNIYFKGFDEEDMKEYFEVFSKYGINLDDFQKDKIIYYAGNAPYLLSIIGHYIIESYLENEEINIDKIFNNKCKAINDYYRDCIKHLERDNDLKRIIPFIIGPNIGVTQSDKDELFNLGYFWEDKGNIVAISRYFVEFLSANMLQISIWDNIINLEKKLKQLIERELSRLVSHFSAKGKNLNDILLDIISKTPGITSNDIARYETFLKNNKFVFNINSSYLDVMSMKDVIKIIKECWNDIFSAYFNNDLFREWDIKFRKCSRARNPIAHGHEEYLSDIDKQEVDTYCKLIFDTISKNIKHITIKSTFNLEFDKNTLSKPANSNISNSNSNYCEPLMNLLGKVVEMLVVEISSSNNLRGFIDGKYRAVIPKNYLKGVNFNKLVNTKIKVELLKINNGFYEVKPLMNNQ